jgi:serine/threonine protein kinase/Tfp pilus assembly protein PilF
MRRDDRRLPDSAGDRRRRHGVVYEAEQQRPKRLVALKVIHGGRFVDDYQIKLFEREAQALARLKHPGIAAIYESGRTPDGQHFFAMELVRGETLKDYLEKAGRGGALTPTQLRERLAIFRKISDAVTYAHQRGVIHRDLKPSNIIIQREFDSSDYLHEPQTPGIKILDFGLARITETDLAVATIGTEVGRIQGTLPYMSPEQVRGNPDEIDVRSDVYSLGVILSEMIAGRRPYDVHNAMLHEAVRVICDTPPEPLCRSWTGPKRLDRDLETIVEKTLEKQAPHRYQSVSALSEDISRFLTGQPILARPPSAVYQLRKLVVRHKVGFGFAASLVVLIAAFAIVMSIQAERIARERDRANQEVETSGQVSDFLATMFEVSDPSEALGNKITAREILDKGAEKIKRDLKGQPLIQARLMNTMGRVYQNLGLYKDATPLITEALNTRRNLLGQEHPDLAESLDSLATLLYYKGEYKDAEPPYREALAMNRKLLGNEHAKVAENLNNLGLLMEAMGKFDESESLLRQALAMRRKLLGAEHPDLLQSLNNLGLLLDSRRKFAEAEPILREALVLRRKILGNEHPFVANTLNNLAAVLHNKGDLQEAESLYREALAMRRKLLGDEHPAVAQSLNNLSSVLRKKGDFKEAEKLLREALAINRKLLGDNHPEVANYVFNLGNLFAAQKDDKQAEQYFRESLEIRRKALQVDHWQTAAAMFQVGSTLIRMRRYSEAEPYLLDCYRINKSQFGVDHAYTQATLNRLVELYDGWKNPQKAGEYRPMLKKKGSPK